MKVDIIGSILGGSGYANNTRNIILSLDCVGVDVRFQGQVPNHTQELKNYLSVKDRLRLAEIYSKPPHGGNSDATLMITIPNGWTNRLSHNLNLSGYLVFEGTKLPTYWNNIISDPRVKSVFYSSKSVLKSLKNSVGLSKKFKYLPHAIDPVFNKSNTPLKSDLDPYKFTFLYVGGWTNGLSDRKGLQYALKAFDKAFTKFDNVQFVAKLNGSYGYRVNPEDEINRLGLRPRGERPNIYLKGDDFDLKGMASLYSLKGCLVNPSMSEGFGLNVIEALASGMPVISTPTGVCEDIKSKALILSEYIKEVPAFGEQYIYENANWFEPSVDDLALKMKEVYDNRDKYKALAVKDADRIKEKFSRVSVGNLLLKSL